MRQLIGRISRENPLWGTERIRGELLKLGVAVSNRSIRRYRWRRLRPTGSQSWRTFLSNQLGGIWAADLLVVQTVSFRTLYVLFFVRHERRELVHFNVTASPTAAWIWHQLLEATPWSRRPSFLVHDRDTVYGGDFDRRLAGLAITGVLTPRRAPKAKSIAERIVRTIRTECLDHLIVIDERHLHAVLTEFIAYYNRDRPHRSLGLQPPIPGEPVTRGPVISRPVLGGRTTSTLAPLDADGVTPSFRPHRNRDRLADGDEAFLTSPAWHFRLLLTILWAANRNLPPYHASVVTEPHKGHQGGRP